MKKMNLLIALTLLLSMIHASCMVPPDAYHFKVEPISHSFEPDVPLKVGLLLTDEFKNATWVWEEHKITQHIGNVFSEKAKEVTKAVFPNFVVSGRRQELAARDGLDALLVPQLISYEKNRPVFGTEDTITTAVFRWTLEDMNKSLIWVEAITVECESAVTKGEAAKAVVTLSPFVAWKRAEDRAMNILARDFFNRSVSAMKSSTEIKEFAENPTF